MAKKKLALTSAHALNHGPTDESSSKLTLCSSRTLGKVIKPSWDIFRDSVSVQDIKNQWVNVKQKSTLESRIQCNFI